MDVLLAIQAAAFANRESRTASTAVLVALGGRLVAWQSAIDGATIRARFRVKNEQERDQFVAAALKIHGVSLAKSPIREEH